MSTIHGRFLKYTGDFVLDLDVEFPARGVTAVFGPSGSGKTTLLRCLAGLEHAAGCLDVDGTVWHDDSEKIFVPPHQRGVGFVFQDVGLFDHLTVKGNLEYGWKRNALTASTLPRLSSGSTCSHCWREGPPICPVANVNGLPSPAPC